NIITARVVPSEGGTTELVSTRAGLGRLNLTQRSALQHGIRHRYAHSRAKIDPDLARAEHIAKWPDQVWRGLWRNPVTGQDAAYIASHACAIDGHGNAEALSLIESIVDALTVDEAVYAHHWQVGDVLIWDERATLHRGMPWPYDQARTLASICISARAEDGLETMRTPPGAGRFTVESARSDQGRPG
ncbi:MAG: TauD/TfdA family dioxygenase, partial [Pseudomonadota bacterium]